MNQSRVSQRLGLGCPVTPEPLRWQQGYGELDARLLAAHARDDKEALVLLYTQAADAAESRHDTQAARFYLTHAYVFALDTGSAEYSSLKLRLDVYDESIANE